MQTAYRFAPDIAYVKSLIGAGRDGISQARRGVHDSMFTPPLKQVAWKSLVAGAFVGALGARA